MRSEGPSGAGARRKLSLRGALGWVLAACLGCALFTACSAAPELDEGTADRLQDRVAAAKQLAAKQDFSAAVVELQQLGEEVASAAEEGLMSQERKSRIEASIRKVRADLEAVMAPAEPQPGSPAPVPEPPAGNDGTQQEETQEEAEKQREEAQKEAEKQRKEAQKEAEKQRKEAQKKAEEGED